MNRVRVSRGEVFLLSAADRALEGENICRVSDNLSIPDCRNDPILANGGQDRRDSQRANGVRAPQLERLSVVSKTRCGPIRAGEQGWKLKTERTCLKRDSLGAASGLGSLLSGRKPRVVTIAGRWERAGQRERRQGPGLPHLSGFGQ